MENGKKIGLAMFVIGLVIITGYGLYQGFEAIEEYDLVVVTGVTIMIIGFLVLFITIILEQQKNKKKMKQEIKKEDLEP